MFLLYLVVAPALWLAAMLGATVAPKRKGFNADALKRKLAASAATDDDLRKLAEQVVHAAARTDSGEGPQTPNELHLYIWQTYGIDIPRVAVCKEHGHRSPFEFVCAVFFETSPSVFGMGPRGGGKSFLMALCHHLKARFKPGYWGATYGAVEHQAKRVYDSFVGFLDRGRDPGKQGSEVKEPKISETKFLNGSKVEIFTGCLPGSAKVVTPNGPMTMEDICESGYDGDVRSFNFDKRAWEWKKVIGRLPDEPALYWMRAELDDGFPAGHRTELVCTPNHEVFRPDGERIPLMHLEPGEEIMTGAGPMAILSLERFEEEQDRYDLTIEGNRNYLLSSGVLVGNTVAAVNGPHPNTAHSDEVEIMRAPVWKESRNMAQDSVIDGIRLLAQNVGTSTRKWKNGRVDRLMKESIALIKKGLKPVWDWYTWCIFEVARERPHCQHVPEEERIARIKELGPEGLERIGLPRDLDPCATCDCDQYVNDFWDGPAGEDGDQRSLADVCRGRFARSRGYRSAGEIQMLFMQNDRRTWEAQQECIEAESEGLYVPSFRRSRHGIARFQVNLANGPIFNSVDFGFTAAGAVLWFQLLSRAVSVANYETGQEMVLPAGAVVYFNELYRFGKTDQELGQLAIAEELKMSIEYDQTIRVRRRWGDMASASGRKDWRKLGLKTHKYDREFETQIKKVAARFAGMKAFIVIDKCPVMCDEIEGWHKDENGNEVKEFQHLMSALRYGEQGLHEWLLMNSDELTLGGGGHAPASRPLENQQTGPAAQLPEQPWGDFRSDNQAESDWRAAMGAPL